MTCLNDPPCLPMRAIEHHCQALGSRVRGEDGIEKDSRIHPAAPGGNAALSHRRAPCVRFSRKEGISWLWLRPAKKHEAMCSRQGTGCVLSSAGDFSRSAMSRSVSLKERARGSGGHSSKRRVMWPLAVHESDNLVSGLSQELPCG